MICGSPSVDPHHVRLGNCTRAKAEEYGLLVYVCRFHHEQIHHNERLKKALQIRAQEELEKTMSHEEYMAIFKKNYKGD